MTTKKSLRHSHRRWRWQRKKHVTIHKYIAGKYYLYVGERVHHYGLEKV